MPHFVYANWREVCKRCAAEIQPNQLMLIYLDPDTRREEKLCEFCGRKLLATL